MECTYYLKGCLGYRLLEVTAGRRYCTTDCYRTCLSVLKLNDTSSFVECCDRRLQVCWECFLARDLLKTAGHLSHGLCPSGCGVCKQEDVESHLPVVLAQGYCCVYRCFTCSNWHGGCVTDDHCSFHKGTACPWVCELWEFLELLYYLTGTLSAGCNDYNINLCVLGCDLLEYCLSCSEWARDTICTALCNREECVDQSYLCDHRLNWFQSL